LMCGVVFDVCVPFLMCGVLDVHIGFLCFWLVSP
jgi:hypothetical protein